MGGIIDQKKIFRIFFFFFPKNGYFFLKKPFSTTKRASRDAHFGPKLPPGMNKICVKFFLMCRKNCRCAVKQYEPIALYIALFVNKYDRFEQQIWLKTPKNHQKQPKSPQITTNTPH